MIYSLLSTLSDNHPQQEQDDYQCVALSRHELLAELKMLLNSRVRHPGIEAIPLINTSVLNFGIDESCQQTEDLISRKNIMHQRLEAALARYEPRLTQVTVTSKQERAEEIIFSVQGYYLQKLLTIQFKWDDGARVFYFDE